MTALYFLTGPYAFVLSLIQCGHGSTQDQLRPTSVNSLSSIQVKTIAAGLWHTLCTSVEGNVYAFGGNQFGQLGTGVDQIEVSPRTSFWLSLLPE